MNKMNPMQELYIEKVVLHATTADQEKLERYKKLLQYITKRTPTITKAKKRIQQFGIRKGLVIGCKVTLRKQYAVDILKLLLAAVKHKLKKSHVGEGVVNFGIKEYIQIPGIEYKRDIGILGFDVSVVLAKKGKRIEYRKRSRGKLGKRQVVTRAETIEFLEKNFEVEVV